MNRRGPAITFLGGDDMAKRTVAAARSCGTCGCTFFVIPSRQHKAKFCNARCRDEGNQRPLTVEMLLARTHELSSGCLEWTGQKTKGGYGQFRGTTVHRLMYQLAVGPIPAGHTIDHVKERSCVSRACILREHLEAVTQRVNNLRGDGPAARRARQTHCKHGHPFDEANTYRRPRGGRECKECRRQQVRLAYWRRKAAG